MPATANRKPRSGPGRWWLQPWGLPVAAMLAVAATDLLLGTSLGLLPLFAAGPALAAGRGSPRTVLGSAALGTALLLLTATVDGLWGHSRVLVALAGIVFTTAAACWVSAARLRAERELVDLREVAETVQNVLMPPLPARLGRISLTGSYRSATRAARVGGDLYQAVRIPGGVRILVADVQGKGLDAVSAAAVVIAAFRNAAPTARTLNDLAAHIEHMLGEQTPGERFVTALLAEIHDDGTVTLLDHGHPAPIVVRAAEPALLIPRLDPAPPLGLAALAGAVDPRPTRFTLHDGDRLLFVTDGLTEARDHTGAFYPLHERAAGLLTAPSPETALQRLRADVEEHTGTGTDDDSALVLCHYGPEPAAPGGGTSVGRQEGPRAHATNTRAATEGAGYGHGPGSGTRVERTR